MKTTTANRLKAAMEYYDLRQVDILKRAEHYCKQYGVRLGRNDISQYISGKVVPGQEKLTVLALALGISEAWLMGYDTPMESSSYEDSNHLKRKTILKDIKNILKMGDYTLSQESNKDDYFLIKDAQNQTITSFYEYDLLSRYESLRKNGNVTAKLLLSSEIAFFNYLESLGYYIKRDDLDHKLLLQYGDFSISVEQDMLDNIRAQINRYLKAAVDSELFTLQEKINDQTQNKTIHSGSLVKKEELC